MLKIIHCFFFKHAVWAAIVLYLLSLLFLAPQFVGYDNIVLSAALVWGEPNVHTFTASYLMMYPLSCLSYLNLPIDIYTLFILLLNGASFAIIARQLCQTSQRPRFVHFMAWAIMVLLFVSLFLITGFSYSSLVGMAAGLLWFITAVRKQKTCQIILASIFIFVSAALRFDSSIGIIPFLLLIMCLEYLKGGRKIVFWAAGLIMIIAAMYLVQSPLSYADFWNNKQAKIVDIHKSRVAFVDYSDRASAEYIEQKQQHYEKVGFTPKLAKMFSSWHFNTPLRESMQWWNDIKAIRSSHDYTFTEDIKNRLGVAKRLFKSSVEYALYNIVFLSLLVLFSIVFIVKNRGLRKGAFYSLPIILYAGMYFFMIIALCLLGRPNMTALSSIFPVSLLLVMLSIRDSRLQFPSPVGSTLSALIVIVTLCTAVYKYRDNISTCYSPFERKYEYPVLKNAIESEMKANPHFVYFAFGPDYRTVALPYTPLLRSDFRQFPHFFPLGGWTSCLPYYENKLQEVGIKNDIELIATPFARFVVFEKRAQTSQLCNQDYVLAGLHAMVDYYNEFHNTDYSIIEDKYVKDAFKVYKIVASKGSALEPRNHAGS